MILLLWILGGFSSALAGFYINYREGNSTTVDNLISLISASLVMGPFLSLVILLYLYNKHADKVVIKGKKNE